MKNIDYEELEKKLIEEIEDLEDDRDIIDLKIDVNKELLNDVRSKLHNKNKLPYIQYLRRLY